MPRDPLTVCVSDERGRPLPATALERWLRRTAPAGVRGVVSIALVSDARIRSLNRRFRGQNKATDVLSFPAGPRPRTSAAHRVRPFLGDIVIARGVARRQARAAGHQ